MFQRIRQKQFPLPPKNVTEINDAFANHEIMNEFGMSNHTNSSPFFKTAFECLEYKYCILASDAIIDLITENIPEANREYFMDATFRIVPNTNGIFNQLLIIYVQHMSKLIPFIHVLMSRKTTAAYTAVFRYIHNNILPLRGHKFIIDYEQAIKRALQAVYGDSMLIVHCWFHFCQAVRKNAMKHAGLMNFIRSNDVLSSVYYKIMCLPLLPPDEIGIAYQNLESTAHALNSQRMNSFFGYFERQWLEKVRNASCGN